MKQIMQNYKTGELKIEDVPTPLTRRGGAKIRTRYSLISAGTERATLEISRKNLLGKAKARPDLVKKVMDTTRKIGIKNTFDLVMNKLNASVPLGYSLSGVVLEIADDVSGIRKGDRVACAGAGYANHSEEVFVPRNLMAKIPDSVTDQEAAFTTVGSIALHGVRQAGVHIGDNVGVIGLGLVGQMTVSLLKAHGCRVLGIDLNERSVSLSKEMGAEMAVLRNDSLLEEKMERFTNGIGLDSIIITAGTDSNDPFMLSSQVMRDRGVLVVVGGIRMEIVKSVSSLFYLKEIDIRFSRSYGPGRYDAQYEEKGNDYPPGYVRWTENRNMICFLDLIETGKIDIKPLVTHTFPFSNAMDAYKIIEGEQSEFYVGILLSYEERKKHEPAKIFVNEHEALKGTLSIGMIGAGNFAQANILPFLKGNPDVRLNGICTAKGMTAKSVAEKFRFKYCAGDPLEILDDKDSQLVFIATRHDSHAEYVVRALRKGKHVFVEKPLCVSLPQLEEIIKTVAHLKDTGKLYGLMVGYNRRFAPSSLKLKSFFGGSDAPVTLIYRVNAGYMPPDNWYQDPAQGGRFVGEGCHFVDFAQFITGSVPVSVHAFGIPEKQKTSSLVDNLTVSIQMKNGSLVVIVYNASGAPNMPKERVEVLGMNSSAVLDDFKALTLYRGGKKTVKRFPQDKGYHGEIASYLLHVKTGKGQLISFNSLVVTSLTTFAAVESMKERKRIDLDTFCPDIKLT
ncbi:MAG: bi-domain-containing oxidoreductase [Proteobacteria bacterium]|nr:bi-domain-containing oxidoreductase [Pseudomonadota bacterium]